MELENLRDSWRAANDATLPEQTEQQLKKIAGRVTAGRMQSSIERLRRRWRLGLLLIAVMPVVWISPMLEGDPPLRTLCWGALCIFLASAMTHILWLLRILERCDPLDHSVRTISEAVVRLRRTFLRNAAIHLPMMILLLWIFYRQHLSLPFHEAWAYGFWTGIALGLPIGIRLFLRILSDIDLLAKAVRELDE